MDQCSVGNERKLFVLQGEGRIGVAFDASANEYDENDDETQFLYEFLGFFFYSHRKCF